VFLITIVISTFNDGFLQLRHLQLMGDRKIGVTNFLNLSSVLQKTCLCRIGIVISMALKISLFL
jgi:hypothetical protein